MRVKIKNKEKTTQRVSERQKKNGHKFLHARWHLQLDLDGIYNLKKSSESFCLSVYIRKELLAVGWNTI